MHAGLFVRTKRDPSQRLSQSPLQRDFHQKYIEINMLHREYKTKYKVHYNSRLIDRLMVNTGITVIAPLSGVRRSSRLPTHADSSFEFHHRL